MIPFCETKFFFLGAMVRWPFLAPVEGFREDEDGVGLRCLMVPWAIVFGVVGGWGLVLGEFGGAVEGRGIFMSEDFVRN